jgi:hypothetical protein
MLEVEDGVTEKHTTDFARKAKKKMREIEALKAKPFTTDEEKRKIQEEDFWKTWTPSSKKLETHNAFGITHSLRECCVKEGDDCPICLNPICKSMGVTTNCNHSYCRVCVSELVNNSKKMNCSLCRAKITNLDFQNEDYMFEIMETLSKKKGKKMINWDEYMDLDGGFYRRYRYGISFPRNDYLLIQQQLRQLDYDH